MVVPFIIGKEYRAEIEDVPCSGTCCLLLMSLANTVVNIENKPGGAKFETTIG